MRKVLSVLAVVTLAALAAVTLGRPQPAAALENGLARTPPMGFNNWNATECTFAFNESFVLGSINQGVVESNHLNLSGTPASSTEKT